MKVAFVYDAVYPYIKGGGEKRYYEMARRLVEKNMEVHIYGQKLWAGNNLVKKEGIFYHGIAKAVPLYTKEKRRSIKEAIYFGLSCFKLLKEDFDLIDCCGFPYFSLFSTKFVTILKNKPLYSTWHEVWGKEYWKSYLGKLGILGYWIEKLASKLPNKIISVSEHTTSKLILDLGVPKDKIITIPNGIDYDYLQTIKTKKTYESDIVFAGRLLAHKNIDLLIRAVRILKNNKKNYGIKVTIIGDGPEMPYLKELTNSLNLQENIRFTGFINKEDEMYSMIKSSKVFVLPSDREGFGIIAIEANALGIPVITLDSKDNASKFLIKEGKNGFVTNKDEESLTKTIEKALKQSKKMKSFCINEARGYDWSNVITKFKEIDKWE